MFRHIATSVLLCLASSSAMALSLQANLTSNNGGNAGGAMYMDLRATSPVRITGLTTGSWAPANGAFSIEVFRRNGSALGGPSGSTAGWESIGVFPATQGPVNEGISLPIDIAAGGLIVRSGQTVGIAIRFTGFGARYYGLGETTMQTFQNADLRLFGGEARNIAFDPEFVLISRALVGEIRYEILSGPDLSVTIDGTPDLATAGEEVTYVAQIANTGIDPADDAEVELVLPPGATLVSATPSVGGSCADTVCSWPDPIALGTGPSATYVVTHDTAGEREVGVTVSTSSSDIDPSNDAATTTTRIENANLSVTIDGPLSAQPGATLFYTVVATNDGPSDAVDVVVGLESLTPAQNIGSPSALSAEATSCGAKSCTFAGTTVPGQSRTVTIVVPLQPDAGGSVIATALASSTARDADLGNNTAQATTMLSRADLVASLDAITPAIAGETLEYVARVSNEGDATAVDVAIVFTPPAGLAIDSADGDDGASCAADRCTWSGDTEVGVERVAQFRVALPSAADGALEARIDADTASDEIATNNNTDTLVLDVTRVGDLQIDKDDGLAWTRPGNTLVYVITAANAGPSDLPGVGIADLLPQGLDDAQWACVQAESTATCPTPPDDAGDGDLAATIDLPAGSVLRFDVTATVAADAGTTIVNTATIAAAAGDTDPDPENNSASDSTLVAPDAIHADGFENAGKGLTLPAAHKAHDAALQRMR